MNWIAIIVSALVAFVVGAIWYGPLFKNKWMAETGMTEEKAKEGNMPLVFGLSFLFAILISFFLYNFVWHHEEVEFHTFQHGAFHGFFLAILIVLPTLGTNALYEQKSWSYILINVGYWLVTITLMGGILNIWR